MGRFTDFFKSKPHSVETAPVQERSHTYGDVTVSSWDAAFGYGKEVDKISIVYGCINLRASAIAALPVELKLKVGDGYEDAIDHPYYNLLTKRPNGFQTNYTFWHWVVTQLDMFGNVYCQRVRNGAGMVVELIPLNPSDVQIEIRDGLPYCKMFIAMPPKSSNEQGAISQVDFTNDQIIHFKGYSQNGVYGLSPVEAFRNLYAGYAEMESAGTQITKNAAKPNGIIYHPVSVKEDELKRSKENWSTGFSGNNAGKTSWMPNSYKFEGTPNMISAKDSEFIAQKTFSATRIVTDIFRCPAYMFNLTNNPTYASVEQQGIEFVRYTLNPIIINLQQQLQKQLLDDSDDVCVEFDTTLLVKGDLASRREYYKFALEYGVMTPNEVIRSEDGDGHIPSEQGGDTYRIPSGQVIATDAAAPVVPTPPTEPAYTAPKATRSRKTTKKSVETLPKLQ